jgi:hypothetical protein
LRIHDGGIGALHAIPAFVAIHRVIAPGYRADAIAQCVTLFLHQADAGLGRTRRCVAAIQKGMHAKLLHTLLLGEIEHRQQVQFVTMHATR